MDQAEGRRWSRKIAKVADGDGGATPVASHFTRNLGARPRSRSLSRTRSPRWTRYCSSLPRR